MKRLTQEETRAAIELIINVLGEEKVLDVLIDELDRDDTKKAS